MFFFKERTFPIKRYLLKKEEKILFSVSKATLKEMAYHSDVDYHQVDIDCLEKIEKDHLLGEALKYLSMAERSPMAFSQWLNNRSIPTSWCDLLIQTVISKKFLSEARFAVVYANNCESRGGKPRWLVVNELENKKVSRAIAEEIEYSDTKSVKNYLKRNRFKFEKNQPKVIDNLYKRGFSSEVVRAVTQDPLL